MSLKSTDPRIVFRNVVQVLDRGQRTSTYKLATMTALIDFSVARGATSASPLEVPLAELARLVMTLYWDQLKPFRGSELRQSTQNGSRIFEAIESVRSAAAYPDDDLTLEGAAGLAPRVYRRAVDDVAVCLAQQPLPRLQRVGGAARSMPFLYEDSFLHDHVTRSELARHRNAIQLFPGVPHTFTLYAKELRRIIQAMWVDDVIRINRMSPDQQLFVETHLFGTAHLQSRPLIAQGPKVDPGEARTPSRLPLTESVFARRLNHLFATAQPVYSSGEVANRIRQSGFPMTVGTLTKLRAGTWPHPSEQTIKALAHYFGVDPSYFFDSEGESQGLPETGDRIPDPDTPSAEERQVGVFTDDLSEIAASCEISPNGCWSRPSNTPVTCRPPGDNRRSRELPKIVLYRWAWLAANGYQNLNIPSNLLRVRHTCGGFTCCNPQHLYVTSPTGSPLSKTAIDGIIRRLAVGSNARVSERQCRLVLPDNIDAIRNHCYVERPGCWIAPGGGPMPCRPAANGQPDGELPMMAPHRWVWMVTNRRSQDPLPANYHVRRNCRNERCCRPGHLRLTTAEGYELTLEEAERQLRQEKTGPASRPPKPAEVHFAARLNKLFETHLRPDGDPFSSDEVAAVLQEDGLPVSGTLIERLRTGTGDPPNARTADALAFFFNVDVEYFFAGTHSAIVTETEGADATQRLPMAPTTPPRPDEQLEISTLELGCAVTGLSETIAHLLESGGADDRIAMNLLELLTEIGDVIATTEDAYVIERTVLQRLVDEWNTAARQEEHQLLIAALNRRLMSS